MTPVSRRDGKLVVRTNCDEATPYLRSKEKWLRHLHSLVKADRKHEPRAVDVGCGNGRNSLFVNALGYGILPFDQEPDFGLSLDLNKGVLPVFPQSVNLVLLQYVLMFLKPFVAFGIMDQALDICENPATVVVELFAAKDGYYKKPEDVEKLHQMCLNLAESKGFRIMHRSKYRFMATNIP